MKKLSNYVRMINEDLSLRRGSTTIWSIENAIADLGTVDRPEIRKLIGKVDDRLMAKAIREVEDDLLQVLNLFDAKDEFNEDEQLLFVTNISSAYCVELFAARTARPIPKLSTETAMRRLAEETRDYQDPGFLKALRSARSNYPNPLPAPLQFERNQP